MTEEVLKKCEQADAVFFGSAGGPEWGTSQPNPESGLLRIRKRMQVCWLHGVVWAVLNFDQIFANLRPCKFASKTMVDWSPIKREVIEGVDFMLIRENCGGAYYGNKVPDAPLRS